MAEIEGKDKAPHHSSELHQNLIKTVVPLRTAFRKESSVEARQQIAQEEFDAWLHYLTSRKDQISSEMPDFHID